MDIYVIVENIPTYAEAQPTIYTKHNFILPNE